MTQRSVLSGSVRAFSGSVVFVHLLMLVMFYYGVFGFHLWMVWALGLMIPPSGFALCVLMLDGEE